MSPQSMTLTVKTRVDEEALEMIKALALKGVMPLAVARDLACRCVEMSVAGGEWERIKSAKWIKP